MNLQDISAYLNFTQLLVLFTFVHAIACLPNEKNNRLLLSILFLCLSNELISLIFMMKKIDNGLLFSINITIHHLLWLLLMSQIIKRKSLFICTIILFLGFALINMLVMEGWANFNYNTFICGALIYIIIFIYESFSQLKKESFHFFEANSFILLSAPVLFFLGLSFIFGFRSHDLSVTKIYRDIHLYALIGSTVNIAYYSLINLYIYYENKHPYVQ